MPLFWMVKMSILQSTPIFTSSVLIFREIASVPKKRPPIIRKITPIQKKTCKQSIFCIFLESCALKMAHAKKALFAFVGVGVAL